MAAMLQNQRYEFPIASVHDDMYEIIKYATEEMSPRFLFERISTPGDHEDTRILRAVLEKKIMQLWRAFVEPMLGISRRVESIEDIEEATNVRWVEARDFRFLESEGWSRRVGRVFDGNKLFFDLFKLHHMLYHRLLLAKVELQSAAHCMQKRNYGGAAPNLYAEFMHTLKGLLDRSVEKSESFIGTQFYKVSGVGKHATIGLAEVAFNLVQQLVVVATDDVALKLLALNGFESAGGAVDEVNDANASELLDNEKTIHFEYKPNSSELLVSCYEFLI